MRKLLSISWCIALTLSTVARPQAKTQEPNPLEMAAPCKTAGQQAEAAVSGVDNAGSYQTALMRLRKTVEAFVNQHGEAEETSLHCLNSYGAALVRLGEFAEASRVYGRAVSVASKTFGPDGDSTLTLQQNLAVSLVHMGSLQEAERLLTETVSQRNQLEGTPQAHKLALVLMNLAMVESDLGELDKSREHGKRGFDLSQKFVAPNDPRWGTILHDYGMVVDQGGSRSEGQQYFEQSLTARLERGDQRGAIDSLTSLAASFYDSGRIEEADKRYSEAYDLAKRNLPPLHPTIGDIARDWCRILTTENRLEESLSKCDEAIQIFSAHDDGSKTKVYLAQINRGTTLGLLNRNLEAINLLSSTLAEYRKAVPASTPGLLEGIRSLGLILVESGRIDEGASLLHESYEGQRALFGDLHPDVLLTQGNYGVVLAVQGKLQEAEAVLTDYATKSEKLRGLVGRDGRTTRGVFSRFAATRMYLARLLVGEGRCQAAFDWIENTKARSLREQIDARASIDAAAQTDRDRFGALEQARTRLYTERAESSGDGAKQTAIDIRLGGVDEEIGKLVDTASRKRTNGVQPDMPSTALLRTDVPSGTVLESFGMADNEVIAVSYRAGAGFQCTSFGDWSDIGSTLWAVRTLQASPGGMAGLLAGSRSIPASRIVKTGDRSFKLIPRSSPIPPGASVVTTADEVSDRVGEELMGWLVRQSGASKRLVLSPDGLLNLVSFDALSMNGKPLISKYSISEVTSFAPSAVRESHRLWHRNENPTIAIGDAVYSPSDVRPSTSVVKASIVVRGTSDEEAEWGQLPASAREISALSTLFRLTPGKTVFTGRSASVQAVQSLNRDGALGKARYLIFSAHAFADVSDPELSSIVLSVPSGGKPRDAYLTATEIGALKLNTDLVFFSACDTGYGQVISGEGVLSLASAALIAGSRATIHTLWSVVDESSAEFTKQFFMAVRTGTPPEEALTRTKRAFSSRKSSAYWAPYVLVQ